MILGHPFAPSGYLIECAECGRVEGSHARTLRGPTSPPSRDELVRQLARDSGAGVAIAVGDSVAFSQLERAILVRRRNRTPRTRTTR